MPAALEYLWQAFLRLSNRRGAARTWSWADLDAFQRATGLRLAPWEVEIVEKLDRLYLAEDGKSRQT
ncbi:hypothetical protein [Mesorhizobium sp. M6A.T.Ce.TU.016.01.1.1]|uniref:phage tail assembly chaperone n=1 Tax=Mesorhizobium sp. M6A.T.Ce.TU.016.01.1.1 TaxID=2496783 RepID=UPI001FE18F92|nr:hypothetical protein [Mesorhizobium sp. M6A.T.Ce.TU.016.01.1.1]